jgi:hypothetical protein
MPKNSEKLNVSRVSVRYMASPCVLAVSRPSGDDVTSGRPDQGLENQDFIDVLKIFKCVIEYVAFHFTCRDIKPLLGNFFMKTKSLFMRLGELSDDNLLIY